MPLGKQFYATFSNGTAGGVTGLVPLILITSQSLGGYTQSALITNASMSAVTNCSGSYFYNFTTGDLTQNNYFATMYSTSSSLDSPVSYALWTSQQSDVISFNQSNVGFTGSSVTLAGALFPVNTITNQDKAGYSINVNTSTSNAPASLTLINGNTFSVNTATGVISFGGTANLSTNALTFGTNQTWPTNLSFLSINASGFVTALNATNGTNSVTVVVDNATSTRNANLVSILGTILTETAGFLAAGFKKFFNITTPTLTVAGVDQTGDSFPLSTAIKVSTDNLPIDPASTTDIGNATGATLTAPLSYAISGGINTFGYAMVNGLVTNSQDLAILKIGVTASASTVISIGQGVANQILTNGTNNKITTSAAGNVSADLRLVNGSTSAATALSFAHNDTQNNLIVNSTLMNWQGVYNQNASINLSQTYAPNIGSGGGGGGSTSFNSTQIQQIAEAMNVSPTSSALTNSVQFKLDEIISATGGLSGPSGVTLHYQDNASSSIGSVEFTLVGVGSGRAGSNGTATFGMNNGTYTLVSAVTNFVVFPSTTLIVSGTTTKTIVGQSVVPPTIGSGQCIGYGLLQQQGLPLVGGTLTVRGVLPPPGSGHIYDAGPYNFTSNASGIVSAILASGDVNYELQYLGGAWAPFSTPITSGATFNLPNAMAAVPQV